MELDRRRILRLFGAATVLAGMGLLAPAGFSQAMKGTLPPSIPQTTEPDDDADSETTKQLKKLLTDPDALEKAQKEKSKPPFEFYKSQVQPNDVLPFVKANQWNSMVLELQSNYGDYEGMISTRPIPLANMPHEIIFQRDARLVKSQRARLILQFMMPFVPRELGVTLSRPDSLREDELWQVPMRMLEPHQMLIVALTGPTNDAYAKWNQLRCLYPASARRSDPSVLDRQRYYRMVVPAEPERPPLSAHPLSWASISHVVWDGAMPEYLNIGQQQALIDWLHWGGQLIVVGGGGPTFGPIRESFLAPFLPAEPAGANALLNTEDLDGLSQAFPPPSKAFEPDDLLDDTRDPMEAYKEAGRRYVEPEPIRVPKDKPLYNVGLNPKPGATVIPFPGKAGRPPLGVEWRVGRGRVLMLGMSLSDPPMLAWRGYDTYVRRIVLRRPEERQISRFQYNAMTGAGFVPAAYSSLGPTELSWYTLFGRDFGAPMRRFSLATDEVDPSAAAPKTSPVVSYFVPPTPSNRQIPAVMIPTSSEWTDDSALPTMSREMLERASGIEIPGSTFVLKVIFAYLIALIPLNWLICRYVIGRREWAWVAAPLISIAFAVVVERAAAYDIGFDSASDEIDLIETHGAYPRGHISRIGSLYTTGRVRYTISYPNDPAAVALPFNRGRSIRGEDVSQSIFKSYPSPMLTEYQVQPRSLAMFRAEQLASLSGTVQLVDAGGVSKVVNRTEWEIRDAAVFRPLEEKAQITYLGRLAPGAEVELKNQFITEDEYITRLDMSKVPVELRPLDILNRLATEARLKRPEEVGELRLVGWIDKPLAGQTIDPPVDRRRGFTIMVAHLTFGATPDPGIARYNALAVGPESPDEAQLRRPPMPTNIRRTNPPGFLRRATPPPPVIPPAAGEPAGDGDLNENGEPINPMPPPSVGPASRPPVPKQAPEVVPSPPSPLPSPPVPRTGYFPSAPRNSLTTVENQEDTR